MKFVGWQKKQDITFSLRILTFLIYNQLSLFGVFLKDRSGRKYKPEISMEDVKNRIMEAFDFFTE